MLSRTLSLLLILSVVAPVSFAQEGIRYALDPESKFWVEGTSNQSDWTVSAKEFDGFVRLSPDFPDGEAAVVEVHLEITAKKILSGKSPIMDRLAHQTLKAEQNPTIVYDLSSADVAPSDTSAGYLVGSVGTLTIAGLEQEVQVPVLAERRDDDSVRFTGRLDTRLTSFKMKPPSAMFGALHTADPVTIHFDLVAIASNE
jgi:polyisoprenoid-binding protein YceI